MMASWEIRRGPGLVCVVCLIQIVAAGKRASGGCTIAIIIWTQNKWEEASINTVSKQNKVWPSFFHILEYQNDELMIIFTLLYVQVLSRAVSSVLEDMKIFFATKRKLWLLLSYHPEVLLSVSRSAEGETISGSVMNTLFSVELCVSTGHGSRWSKVWWLWPMFYANWLFDGTSFISWASFCHPVENCRECHNK